MTDRRLQWRLALGVAALGVAALGAAEASLSRQGPALERLLAPFPVADSAGRPWDMPFLGGFDAPRPQLVDIDADGDLDLFVQEQTGELTMFEHVSDAGGHRFVWRTDRFAGLDIGEWYRFADLDGDGDADLLGELPFSYVRAWRNDSRRAAGAFEPRFTPLGDTLRDTQGRAIFADRQNIAQLGDVDCDRRPDLLIGRIQGTIMHYVLDGASPDGGPRFRFITDRFEDIEIVGQMQPGAPVEPGQRPTMHGANTMALADLDGDGDADLLWGDFFEAGLLFIENTGSCGAMNLRSVPEPWPVAAPIRTSGYNAPAVGDLDGDGALDVLVGVLGGAFNPMRTAADNLYHLARTSRGWELESRRFLRQLDVGSEALPALADLDGDGDLDLVVANRVDPADHTLGLLRLFRNTGGARAPALRDAGVLPVRHGFQQAPAFGDLDGDGDLDLLTGGYAPGIAWWRNDGDRAAPRFVLVDSSVARIPRGSNTTPALADLDGDGDLDLVVGEAAGNLNLYRNDGSRAAPVFTLATENWLDFAAGRRSAPLFADLDQDGDADLLIGTVDGVWTWRRGGSAQEPRFLAEGPLALGVRRPLLAPAMGDLDGDGRPELLLGTGSGGLLFFRLSP